MDIAAKLGGEYTLAGCFQTAISPSARCGGCTAVIGRLHPKGARRPSPTSRDRRLKRAGYTMFRDLQISEVISLPKERLWIQGCRE
jgi:hypothetical protein